MGFSAARSVAHHGSWSQRGNEQSGLVAMETHKTAAKVCGRGGRLHSSSRARRVGAGDLIRCQSTRGNVAAALFAAQRSLLALRLLAVRCCAGRIRERAVCKDDRETANNSRAWQRYLYGEDGSCCRVHSRCSCVWPVSCRRRLRTTKAPSWSRSLILSAIRASCCPRFIC